jgi:peroxiredoxin
MKKVILILSAMVASTVLVFSEAEVGKAAPDFTAKDIHGKTHKLADFKGKIVVLEAYNLDCPFCANHYKTGAMPELQKEVTDQGGIWLVINSVHPKHGSYRSADQANKEFKGQKMNATAWIDDSSGAIGKAYGLKTTPHLVVIDPKGIVAYNGAIDDRPEASGEPRTAKNYVRVAFQSLKAGKPVEVARSKPYGCSVKYAE